MIKVNMDYSILDKAIQENHSTKINATLDSIANDKEKTLYLNFVENKFNTPLMSAYRNDDIVLFDKLLSLGSSLTQELNQNNTVAELILESIHENVENAGSFSGIFNNFDKSDEKFLKSILNHLNLDNEYENYIHKFIFFKLSHKKMPELFKICLQKIKKPEDLFVDSLIHPKIGLTIEEDDILANLLFYGAPQEMVNHYINKINSFNKLEEIIYIDEAFDLAVKSCHRLDASADAEQKKILKNLIDYQKIYHEKVVLLESIKEKEIVKNKIQKL